jgi:uncharacterized protein
MSTLGCIPLNYKCSQLLRGTVMLRRTAFICILSLILSGTAALSQQTPMPDGGGGILLAQRMDLTERRTGTTREKDPMSWKDILNKASPGPGDVQWGPNPLAPSEPRGPLPGGHHHYSADPEGGSLSPGQPSVVKPQSVQKAVLYEEEPTDPNGRRFVGSVVWRAETVSPGPGLPPDLAVRADVEVPERKLTMSWSLRRNIDKSLPASHTIELIFKVPPDFPAGGISSVPGILLKQVEQTRGVPLSGLGVKVTDSFFLIGLSSVEAERERNIQLLKDRPWFDIPINYQNGRRAILAMEKGILGESVFTEVFAAWDTTRPKTQATIHEGESRVQEGDVTDHSVPSFDCKIPTHVNEKLICQSTNLSALDGQMTALFSRIRNLLNRADRRQLEQHQKNWLKERMDCEDDSLCTKEAYYDRIDQLSNILAKLVDGAPAEEGREQCRVSDPNPPLTVRTAPHGGSMVGSLPNGTLVAVLDFSSNKTWVFVEDEDRSPIGWVYGKYLDCKVIGNDSIELAASPSTQIDFQGVWKFANETGNQCKRTDWKGLVTSGTDRLINVTRVPLKFGRMDVRLLQSKG